MGCLEECHKHNQCILNLFIDQGHILILMRVMDTIEGDIMLLLLAELIATYLVIFLGGHLVLFQRVMDTIEGDIMLLLLAELIATYLVIFLGGHLVLFQEGCTVRWLAATSTSSTATAAAAAAATEASAAAISCITV
ncbi:hypothetical protein EMWEY_00057150 [Eimeria maxima]|uniref:Uncharacterized protein n=1 Tax=Eimeria maxima TaxID=5804 RepID=U6M4R9_EIMMA|nr:hypothetical protein EMWEY_00057150 [Eimeria maxima]CDJ56670.1 hypothetical protein EMWEY_00057150 [Eimeria maxima]